jgi:UDP-2-acetamido-3-amino-2,3-dideoxy-glucuronate N-acetyltransferase
MQELVHPTALIDARAVVDEGASIGAETRVWHFSHVMSGAKIGRRCTIGQGCFVAGRAILGDGVKLQNHVSVFDGVELRDEVFCGPGAVFTNVSNPRAAIPRKHEYQRTLVEENATIGANATVVPGVTVGSYAFVGAGALVTRDVPAFGLVVGVPARRVGWMSRQGARLRFDEAGRATCPLNGEVYWVRGDRVVLAPCAPGPNSE